MFIPKAVLAWLTGLVTGALLTASIYMLAIDSHRFYLWAIGIYGSLVITVVAIGMRPYTSS